MLQFTALSVKSPQTVCLLKCILEDTACDPTSVEDSLNREYQIKAIYKAIKPKLLVLGKKAEGRQRGMKEREIFQSFGSKIRKISKAGRNSDTPPPSLGVVEERRQKTVETFTVLGLQQPPAILMR